MKKRNSTILSKARSKVFIFAIIFMGLGVALLFTAFAAPVTIDLNLAAANGSGVSVIQDQNAEGGSYVQFNDMTPPPPDPDPPTSGSVLPDKIVGGYLEGWIPVFPSQLPDEYNFIFHAFGKVGANGAVYEVVSVNDTPRLQREYREFMAEGKVVVLSIGGHEGASAGLTTDAQVTNFVQSIIPIIEQWGFMGIDWDLELGIPGGISSNGIVSASRQLKTHFGEDFMITMAPIECYVWNCGEDVKGAYQAAACSLGNDLTFVGNQNYNIRDRVTAQAILSIMQTYIQGCNLRPDQYALGFWWGENYYPTSYPGADWMGHQYTEAYMAEMYQAVEAVYPTVRGAWVWGVAANDASRGFPFPTTLGPAVYN